MITTIPPKPFIKWVGGKSKLIPQIAPYIPKDFKYQLEWGKAGKGWRSFGDGELYRKINTINIRPTA